MKNTIKIQGNLVLSERSDMIDERQTPKVNHVFFLRHPRFHQFYGVYKIADTTSWDIKEILVGLSSDIFYKLGAAIYAESVTIKLHLRKAAADDVCYTPDHVISGTPYFVRTEQDEVTGPHTIREGDSAKHFLAGVERGVLYVISGDQKFEPYFEKSIAKTNSV